MTVVTKDEIKTRTRKHRDIIDRMQAESKTICEYCGAEKEGLSFFIGASLAPAWTMVEGTGKMCCPKCWADAVSEGEKVIKLATGC